MPAIPRHVLHDLVRWAGLLCFLLILPGLMDAQIKKGKSRQQQQQQEEPGAEAAGDSTESKPKRKIVRRTLRIDPNALIDQRMYGALISRAVDSIYYFDELERVGGFVRHLGQQSKPYQRYIWGLDASYFPGRYFINPVTGKEDVYLTNIEKEVLYHDTRTPYFNAWYHQGLRKLTDLQVKGSINVTPFVNTTVFYQRKIGNGAYSDNTTNGHSVYFSVHGHNYSNRLHIFAVGLYDESIEEMNGGVQSDQEFPNLFDKVLESVSLSGASFVKRKRSVLIRPVYRFFTDTSQSRHRFLVAGKILAEDYYQQYLDASYSAQIQEYPVPVYSNIDSVNLYERIKNLKYDLGGEASYRLDLNKWDIRAKAGAFQQFIRHRQDRLDWNEERTRFEGSASIDFEGDRFVGTADFQTRIERSNLFSPSGGWEAGTKMVFGPEVVDYIIPLEEDEADSVKRWYAFSSHRPLEFEAKFIQQNRNPSYFDTYYRGYFGNRYSGDLNLKNTFLNHLRASIAWMGKKGKRNDRDFLQRYIRLTAFISNLDRAIWMDSLIQVQQADPGQRVTFGGLKLDCRINLSRFYLENTITLQRSFQTGTDPVSQAFGNYIPLFHGKVSIFYQNQDLRFAELIRAGVDVNYFWDYDPWFFEPSVQAFYYRSNPSLTIFPYTSIDVFAAIKVKSAYIYVRLTHSNELLFSDGYFTVPYYPMLERTFFFGLNWTLFD